MANKFSGALQITDLDDFITPSQECIKPVEIKRTREGSGSKIKIESDGYYEVEERSGKRQKLEKVEVTLGDCLACSGCITSAEGVLINQQNHSEVLRALKSKGEIYDKVVVSLAVQPLLSLADKYKISVNEAAGRVSHLFKDLGADRVFDMTVVDDLCLLESAQEFVERYRSKSSSNSIPMLSSSCPGWICYAEKTHGSFILPYISTTKSSQQMMGSLVKGILGGSRTYHITFMPCYDKKLEASRKEFFNEEDNSKDVDCVITTVELEQMMAELGIKFESIATSPLDGLWGEQDGKILAHEGSGSGGFAHFLFYFAAKEIFDMAPGEIQWRPLRNPDLTEAILEKDGQPVLKFAIANGFRNIQNIVQKLKRGKCPYDFVEIMACPSGCLNGGAQLRPDDVTQTKEMVARLVAMYQSLEKAEGNTSDKAYEWLGGKDSDKARVLLRTTYSAVEKMNIALNIKW